MASLTEEEQQRLVTTALEGDQAAFEALYKFLQPMLSHCLANIAPDRYRDDIVQTTIAKAFRGLGQFRGDSSFSSWCVAIGRRESLTEHRRIKREAAAIGGEDDTVGNVRVAMNVSCIDPTYEQNLAHNLVHNALAEIESAGRRLAIQLYLQGFTLVEIASAMNRNIGTVRSLISRGKQDIKTILSKRSWPRDADTGI